MNGRGGANPSGKTPVRGIPRYELISYRLSCDYYTLFDQALRRIDGRRPPDVRGPARCGHRIPRAERVGQIDDDADDHGTRHPRLRIGSDRRKALLRAGLAP